jgi:hypothetical protein
MQKAVYGALSKVFAIVLVIIGIAAIVGGNYAHSFVTDQLSQEKISMPDQDSIDALDNDEAAAALTPYIGQQMTTGPQAEAFADHYIHEHMMAASGGKTYEEVSAEYIALSKDANADPNEVQKAADLRQTMFMGDSLRGMLLNAYGWWLIGTIAIYVGIGAIVVGVILGILGWGPLRTKKAPSVAAATTTA